MFGRVLIASLITTKTKIVAITLYKIPAYDDDDDNNNNNNNNTNTKIVDCEPIKATKIVLESKNNEKI